MTGKEVKNYICDTYGTDAINQSQEDMDYDNEWDLFYLLIENKPIPSLHTHSYGFHTRNGRGIIERIKSYYYEYQEI